MNKHDVQRFYGLANYFHRFILGWAKLVAPLQELLKKDKDWECTDECAAAYQGLKDALCSAPVLVLPDLKRPFQVICDATGAGLGAVLVQDGKAIAFWGKCLTEAEICSW